MPTIDSLSEWWKQEHLKYHPAQSVIIKRKDKLPEAFDKENKAKFGVFPEVGKRKKWIPIVCGYWRYDHET